MSIPSTHSKDLILAIDNGTQSVRALIFDLQGNLLAKSRVPIDPYYSTKPGLAEQDPQVFWNALCQACQELWMVFESKPESHLSKERIAGVALTTQRSTVINLDREWKAFETSHCLARSTAHGGSPTGRWIVGPGFQALGHVSYSRLPASRSGG